jgi:hypothetical protein
VIAATVERVSTGEVVLSFANGRTVTVGNQQSASGVQLIPKAQVGACVRAESLRFANDRGFCSGVLADVEYSGSGSSCIVKTDVGDLKMEVTASTPLPAKDKPVQLSVDEKSIHLVAAE